MSTPLILCLQLLNGSPVCRSVNVCTQSLSSRRKTRIELSSNKNRVDGINVVSTEGTDR